jgi:hypothetical protein
MHIAARSYLSTGVALVGAGAIAISPVAPPLPDVKVPTLSSIGVELNAAVNPLQTWVEVFGQAAENLAILGQQIAERPAPILQQVIENQLANIETLAPAIESFAQGLLASLSPTDPDGIPANLREAFELIISGNPAEGVPAIFQAFLQPILFPSLELLVPVQGIITQSAQNVLDVANQAITVVAIGAIGFLSPVFSGFNAVGAAAQAVVDAANDGDIAGVITAVLDIPGVVTGGVLNGFGFDGGILTPMSGTIAALLTLRDTIAQALAPNPPADGILSEGTATTAEEAGTTVTFDITDGEASVTPAALESRTSESPEPGTGGSASLTDEDVSDEVVDQAPEDEAPEDEAPEVEAPEDEAPEDDAAAEDAAAEDEATEQEPSDDADANDTDDKGGDDTRGTDTGDDTRGAEA